MTRLDADVAILGSGFGGSLLSLILGRLGRRCVLIDKSSHPRFAIGESSTPLADFVLSDLAKRYDLPNILPLASYGTWQERHPSVSCGLKRGFSYFAHEPGQPFQTDERNANQLLVAASSNDLDSDTHWHRAEVDDFLFQQAQEAGIECLENTLVVRIARDGKWQLDLDGCSPVSQVRCNFLVDATGASGVLLNHLGVGDQTEQLRTNSRAIYGHFESVRRFGSVLEDAGLSQAAHPYECDNAALHHILDGAWMWNLRFNNDVVSAGVVVSGTGAGEPINAADEWRQWLKAYPSIQVQFADARVVPDVALRKTSRLQRLADAAAGPCWLAMPHSVGFIDPLHSTGIAHTLSAIERVAMMFARDPEPSEAALNDYDRQMRSELMFIDELVSSCYAALPHFSLFKACCMLYFACAHSCEMRRLRGEINFENGFLGTNIAQLRTIVRDLRRLLDATLASNSDSAIKQFEHALSTAIDPFNEAGLCDPAAANMYANTAPPRGFGAV